MIVYKLEETGEATNFHHSRKCPDGYQVLEGDKISDDVSQYHTQEYRDLSARQETNKEAREFLSEGGLPGQTGTGWKVTRHRDQIDDGHETSMTDEEYQSLLSERQTKRNSVIEV